MHMASMAVAEEETATMQYLICGHYEGAEVEAHHEPASGVEILLLNSNVISRHQDH